MWFGLVSLFPEMFQALSAHGVTSRALKSGLWDFDCFNPRDHATLPYRAVDDRVYGGGPGLVLSPEPLAGALNAAKTKAPEAPVIYVSPQGQPLKQEDLMRLSRMPELILLSGRYEGVDERIIQSMVDEEISIGDYVISGGELAIMVILDGLVRLLPGALGHSASAHQDSFSEGILDCPHYTRPELFAGLSVPAVLTSGDHQAIARWRRKQGLGRTWERRPELLAGLSLSNKDLQLLNEYQEECNRSGVGEYE
jgi:tRNA (guanine37-N1)-methyltransferase